MGKLKYMVKQTKRSTSYNIRNSKRLEIHVPTFQTISLGKYTFRYEAVKLWNMLENKYKNMMDLKSFKEGQFTYGQAQCVRVPIVSNVLYIISSHFMYSVLFFVTTSSLSTTYQLASLPSIIQLRHVGE